MSEDQPEPSPAAAAGETPDADKLKLKLSLRDVFKQYAGNYRPVFDFATFGGDSAGENVYLRRFDEQLRIKPLLQPTIVNDPADEIFTLGDAEQIAAHLRAAFREDAPPGAGEKAIRLIEKEKQSREYSKWKDLIKDCAYKALMGGIENLGVTSYRNLCYSIGRKNWHPTDDRARDVIDKIFDDASGCQNIADKCDLLRLCKYMFRAEFNNYDPDKRGQFFEQILSTFESRVKEQDLNSEEIAEGLSDICRVFADPPEDRASLCRIYEWATDHDLISFVADRPAQEVTPVYGMMRPEMLAGVADHMLRQDMIYKYDQLITEAGHRLSPFAAKLDTKRMNICVKMAEEQIKRLRSRLTEGSESVAAIVSEFSSILMSNSSPGPDFLRKRISPIVDLILRSPDNTLRAVQFATDPEIGRLLGGKGLLDDARIATIAERLEKGADKNAAAWFAAYVERNHPQSAPHVAGIKIDYDGQEILNGLAPILSGRSDMAAREFQSLLATVPHEAAAAAQCVALDDVWDALARADGDIAHIVPYGREDLPMEVDYLRALSMDISRMLSVVQTQTPIIMPDGAYKNGNFLPAGRSEFSSLRTGRTVIDRSDIRINAESVSENEIRTQATGFGFLVVQRSDAKTTHGSVLDERRIFAIPVITLDDEIFKVTVENGGEDVLRHFQTIAGLFNHDYFHHLTARIINPYFSNLDSSIPLGDTPFGVLMGRRQTLPAMDPRRSPQHRGHGMEQFNRHYYQAYDEKTDWPVFSKNGNYEYHALHLHNVLYRRYMDDGPAGAKARAALDGYMDGVRKLGDTMAAQGVPSDNINRVKCYYANMMAFHLRRIVPVDHELMQSAEAHIDNLGIDKDYLRGSLRASLYTLLRNPKREQSIKEQSGVDPRADDITPGQAARWNGVLSSVNVLNLLYKKEYAEAQEKALPALRQTISIVARDMRALEYRGGMDAYYAHAVRKTVESHWNKGPPLVRNMTAPQAASPGVHHD